MRRLFLFALAPALLLSACGGQSDHVSSAGSSAVTSAASVLDAVNVASPIAYANTTVLDEKVAIGFETAVATAADLATVAVEAHVVRGPNLPRLAKASADARAAVAAVRAAYNAGNATSYVVASKQAEAAIDAVRAIVKGQ